MILLFLFFYRFMGTNLCFFVEARMAIFRACDVLFLIIGYLRFHDEIIQNHPNYLLT